MKKKYPQKPSVLAAAFAFEGDVTLDDYTVWNARLEALQCMLERAIGDHGGHNYEKNYLRSRIAITEQSLSPHG